jgi:hypothetical protein
MKKIFKATLILFLFPLLSIAQIADTLLRQEVKEIKLYLEKHQNQYSTGTGFIITGFVLNTVGIISMNSMNIDKNNFTHRSYWGRICIIISWFCNTN